MQKAKVITLAKPHPYTFFTLKPVYIPLELFPYSYYPRYFLHCCTFLTASVPTLANADNVTFSTVVSVLLATAANAAVLTYFGQFLHTEQVSSYVCICVLVHGWCDIISQYLICMVFQISLYGSMQLVKLRGR